MTPYTHSAIFHTFGCKLNFAETATIASLMAERGICRATKGQEPDFVVVNTCSVTEESDRKCRRAIRGYNRRYPRAKILVTGCYAQLKSAEVASLPGVVLVVGNDAKRQIARYIDDILVGTGTITDVRPLAQFADFEPSCSRGERTRYFLKVQDGCDYWCTYCTIPRARGRSRSGTIHSMVQQAQQAAEEGGREIVITGVNIGDFGKNTGERFADLIRALDAVPGIERYRISSLEPDLLTDDVLAACVESEHFMPHFHIPLQCGSDEVLRLMRRHYDTALFADKVHAIRDAMPDAFIGVDVIAGARGETEELFEQSYRFIESLPVSRLHVFPYSERPDTRALQIEHVVSQQDKHLRTRRLMDLSTRLLSDFAARYAGTIRPVLLEHSAPGKLMSGFTDNYLRVRVDAPQCLDGQIVNVTLGEFDPTLEEFTASLCNTTTL